jgi:nitrogen fixation NifU-like protein
MSLYREQILEHAKNPSNFGELSEFSVTGKGSNALCGDDLSVQIRLSGENIEQIAFQGHGCALCIASASMLSEEITGMNRVDVMALDTAYMKQLVGIPLSPNRLKCALLSLETVHNALR